MPPASFDVTDVLRIASSKEVLPWSTCPITVTTGGRSAKFLGSSSNSGISVKSTSGGSSSTAIPNSSAIKEAVSKSSS